MPLSRKRRASSGVPIYHETSTKEDETRESLFRALTSEDETTVASLLEKGIDLCWDAKLPNELVEKFGLYLGGSMCSIEKVILGSRVENRIHAALFLAEAFRKHSAWNFLDKMALLDKSAECESVACSLMEKFRVENCWSISKIHHAVLEKKVWGFTPIHLAFNLHSTKFVSNPIVVKYLDNVLRGKEITPSEKYSNSASFAALCLLISFLSSARGRHVCFFCIYVIYVVLQSLVISLRPATPMSSIEVPYIMLCFGFFLHEINQMLADGPGEYFATFWNYLDAIAGVFNLIYFAFRIMGMISGNLYWSNMAFDTLACAAPLVMMRALFLLSMQPTLGQFLINVEFMFKEIFIFLVIIFIVVGAFGQTLFALIGSPLHPSTPPDVESPQSSSYIHTSTMTFAIVFGNFDFSTAKYVHPVFGVVVVMLILLIGTLVLFSLLIAILNEAYEDVVVNLAGEYQLHRAKTILEYSETSFLLPPFNLLTLPLAPWPHIRLLAANLAVVSIVLLFVAPMYGLYCLYILIQSHVGRHHVSVHSLDNVYGAKLLSRTFNKTFSRAFVTKPKTSVWVRLLSKYGSQGDYVFDGGSAPVPTNAQSLLPKTGRSLQELYSQSRCGSATNIKLVRI